MIFLVAASDIPTTCLQVLIVDEVSMVHPEYLDWLDVTVREIRGPPNQAFGGVQLVLLTGSSTSAGTGTGTGTGTGATEWYC